MVVSAHPVAPSSGKTDGEGCSLALEDVDLERPRAGSNHALILEVVDLDKGVVPITADQRALLAQQVERRLVLVLVNAYGSSMPSSGLCAIR